MPLRNLALPLPLMLSLLVTSLWMSTARAAEPTLAEMCGQMLMTGFRGLTLAEAPETAQALAAGKLGGVVLFDYDVVTKTTGRNIASPEQLDALTRDIKQAAPVRPFIAVDQEGGRVMRLKPRYGFPEWPSAAQMGARSSPAQLRSWGQRMGELLRQHGLNLNFAPVLDVNVNPENPVIGKLERSFSESPGGVGSAGMAFMQGLIQAGVLPCIKHFPGHGSSREDSHLGLPDVSSTWSSRELLPFRMAIEAGCPMVMTGHLFNSRWDPVLPATLSPKVLQGMLRKDLGFKGVIVSDDLQMAAIARQYGLRETIRLAVLAGVDILLFGNNLQYDAALAQRVHALLLELVTSGAIPRERIHESYQRIMLLKR
ncbi:glycoside hydrolase family 3 protein [Megalodesulfovibrio paquesii]